MLESILLVMTEESRTFNILFSISEPISRSVVVKNLSFLVISSKNVQDFYSLHICFKLQQD